MSLRKRIKSNLKVPAVLAVTLCLSILSLIELTTNNTTALEFQTDTSGDNAVKLDFTFGETLNITTSDNTVTIPELTPGHSGVSASNYTVTVNTNAQAGYTLSATVGCSSSDTNYNTSCYDSTSLSDGTNTFDMITADGTLSAGEWGIALVNTETVSSFKTLAKWDSAATVLRQTDTAGGGATPFRIGAAATNSQEAGTYQNRINFIAVANVACQSTISGTMQDFAPCSNIAIGTTGTLTDARDDKTYTVAKLADSNWWMTENLAIDLTATSYDTLYGTGTNAGKMTNATSQALGYLKGNTTGDSSDQWAMAAVKKTWTSSYSYSEPWIAVDSITSGKCYSASYCTGGSALTWSSTDTTSGGVAQGKVGVYYNYCAASAGSYCWGNGTSDSGSPSSDPNTSSLRDITSDICPYGWHLPTSTSSGEFQALYTAYSSNYTNFQTALSTPLSGNFYSGKAYDQGNYGSFWPSTWYNSTRMYGLYVDSTSVDPSSNYTRNYGLSVRCVFGS